MDPLPAYLDPKVDKHEMGYVSWDVMPPANTPVIVHLLSFRSSLVTAISYLNHHERWLSETLAKPEEMDLTVGRAFIILFRLLPNEYSAGFFPNTETNRRGDRRAGTLVTYWKIPVWEREGTDDHDRAVLRDGRGRYLVLHILNAGFLGLA